jgi:hypothetical protein
MIAGNPCFVSILYRRQGSAAVALIEGFASCAAHALGRGAASSDCGGDVVLRIWHANASNEVGKWTASHHRLITPTATALLDTVFNLSDASAKSLLLQPRSEATTNRRDEMCWSAQMQ